MGENISVLRLSMVRNIYLIASTACSKICPLTFKLNLSSSGMILQPSFPNFCFFITKLTLSPFFTSSDDVSSFKNIFGQFQKFNITPSTKQLFLLFQYFKTTTFMFLSLQHFFQNEMFSETTEEQISSILPFLTIFLLKHGHSLLF